MLIRRKVAEDAEHVAELARDVHWSDRYPRYLPRDLARFMTPQYESVAWVAEADAQLIGHVALHHAASDPTLLSTAVLVVAGCGQTVSERPPSTRIR